MGWGRGVDLFDQVAKEILGMASATPAEKAVALAAIIDAFEDMDCDTLSECSLFNNRGERGRIMRAALAISEGRS